MKSPGRETGAADGRAAGVSGDGASRPLGPTQIQYRYGFHKLQTNAVRLICCCSCATTVSKSQI